MEFREFAFIFVPRNGILCCFLFRGMVRNGIPRVYFYFCYTEQNSEGIFLFRGMVKNGIEFASIFVQLYRAFFSSKEWFGTEFRNFLFCGTAEIPPEQNICFVYFVFRGIIFCRKLLSLRRSCSWHVALRLYRQNKSVVTGSKYIHNVLWCCCYSCY
jgi:hypothetical protein